MVTPTVWRPAHPPARGAPSRRPAARFPAASSAPSPPRAFARQTAPRPNSGAAPLLPQPIRGRLPRRAPPPCRERGRGAEARPRLSPEGDRESRSSVGACEGGCLPPPLLASCLRNGGRRPHPSLAETVDNKGARGGGQTKRGDLEGRSAGGSWEQS